MRQMGVNCVRIYGWNPSANHTAFLDAAYNGGQRPIYVLLNRWVNPATDWSNATEVNLITAEWLTLTTNVMSHPAILGYILGNELNWQHSNAQDPAFWAALNSVAGAIRQYDTNHLISTALADQEITSTISKGDSMMTNFNVWCLQSYRGSSFGNLFREYATASGKPLLVTEFGMDAYDRRINSEYTNNAELQSQYVTSLWNEIELHPTIVSGGFVFSWADEWWKAGTPSAHNSGGWAGSAFPDGWADEEWWGVHRISARFGAPDVLEPRYVFDQLRALWTARLLVTLPAPDCIQLSVLGAAGQTAVLQRKPQAGEWAPVSTNSIPFSESILVNEGSDCLFRVLLP
jgi:hypothetical protein